MALEIGLQVYSVRKKMDEDFWGTLEKVAEIGYKYIEFANHSADTDPGCGHGIDAYKLKTKMDELGLKAIGNHVHPFEKADLEKVIEYNKIIGNNALGCGIGFFTSKDDILEFSKWLNKIGETCRKEGMNFYYHNHFQEYQKFDGKTVMEWLMENTDDELVKFELDTFWTIRGGADPIEYMRKLGNRCELLHQKDLSADANPVNIFEAIGEDAVIDGTQKFRTITNPRDFTEVGEGTIDIKSIIQEAEKMGYVKYIIVEQDFSSKNEIESIEISFKNLTELISKKINS